MNPFVLFLSQQIINLCCVFEPVNLRTNFYVPQVESMKGLFVLLIQRLFALPVWLPRNQTVKFMSQPLQRLCIVLLYQGPCTKTVLLPSLLVLRLWSHWRLYLIRHPSHGKGSLDPASPCTLTHSKDENSQASLSAPKNIKGECCGFPQYGMFFVAPAI